MKAYKTVIFIFSILGILAILCLVFPTEGVKAGSITLEFPTLAEVLAVKEKSVEPELSPEELLQQRREALAAAKDNEYLSYIHNSEARFYFPNEDISFFDDLFVKLENCGNEVIRIVHYGDSQLEEDRMTSYLRERFQEQFGGTGVGMKSVVPLSGATFTCSQSINPEDRIPSFLVYGPAEKRANHRSYGPMGQVAHIDTTTVISFRTRSAEDFPHAQTFQRIRVRMTGNGSLTFNANGQNIPLKCDTTKSIGKVKLYEAMLPKPVTKGYLAASGYMDVHTIQLDGKKGIVMDNVAMRGCSGTIFTNIDRNSIESFYKQEDVALIILQYGGNALPYSKKTDNIISYCNQIKKQIEFFHNIAPKTKILFIGPSDMATSIGGVMQTYPHMTEFVDLLRKAVNEAGAAYWDMFSAMGGTGSMVKWVKARPQLAGEDYIHFTPKGSLQISEILYGTFDVYYKYYRFRNYDRYNMPDSLAVDSLKL
mgnify:CR=1 FL=1